MVQIKTICDSPITQKRYLLIEVNTLLPVFLFIWF